MPYLSEVPLTDQLSLVQVIRATKPNRLDLHAAIERMLRLNTLSLLLRLFGLEASGKIDSLLLYSDNTYLTLRPVLTVFIKALCQGIILGSTACLRHQLSGESIAVVGWLEAGALIFPLLHSK